VSTNNRIEAIALPYTLRVYSFDGISSYCLTKGCGFSAVVAGDGKAKVLTIRGVEGVEVKTQCRVAGSVVAMGPSTLLTKSDRSLQLYSWDTCRQLVKVKAKHALWAANGYALALVDRKVGRIYLDTIEGVVAKHISELKEVEELTLGVNAALAYTKDLVVAISARSSHILPSSLGPMKPIASSGAKLYMLDTSGRLYLVDEYGVVEPYANCGRALVVVAAHTAIVVCETGFMIGKPSRLVLDFLAVARKVSEDENVKALYCFPYIYGVSNGSLKVYDTSRSMLALSYTPLTGKRMVDTELGVYVSTDVVREVDEAIAKVLTERSAQEGRGGCRRRRITVSGYHVYDGRLVLSLGVDGDELADVVCKANCDVLDLSYSKLVVEVYDPLQQVEIDLWTRSCEEPATLSVEPARDQLGLGIAYPHQCGSSLCATVEDGRALVLTERGWILLDEGTHRLPDEAVYVVDANGVTPLAPSKPKLHIHLDYGRAQIIIEGESVYGVKCEDGFKRVEGGNARVSVLNRRCSIMLGSKWLTLSPIEIAVAALAKLGSRLAKLLQL
jgi:hypothetical protein